MKTRNEINKALTSALTSDTWKTIKNSLVGKELIALGTEIIYQAELVKDSLTGSLDYRTAQFSDLVRLANIEGIGISRYLPSRIRTTNPFTEVMKPFSISTGSGAQAYYNIRPIIPTSIKACADSTIELFSGKTYEYKVGTGASMIGWTAKLQDVATIRTLTISGNVKRYVELPSSVYPASIYVSCKRGVRIVLLNRWTPATSEDDNYFKFLTDTDGTPLLFINLTDSSIDTDNLSIYCLLSSTDPCELEEVKLNGTQVTLLADAQGSVSDDNARDCITQYYAATRYLASYKDLEAYCSSLPWIQDAEAVYDANGTCNVYVIPVAENDATFPDYLLVHLDLYGDMYTNYSAWYGNQLKFDIVVRGITDVTLQQQVTEMFNQEFPYSSCRFDATTTSSHCSGEVTEKTGIYASVTFKVQETGSAFKTNGGTNFPPIANSFKITANGALEAFVWDNAGYLEHIATATATYLPADHPGSLGPSGNFISMNAGYSLPVAWNAITEVKSTKANLEDPTKWDYTDIEGDWTKGSIEYQGPNYVQSQTTKAIEHNPFCDTSSQHFFFNPTNRTIREFSEGQILSWVNTVYPSDSRILFCQLVSSDNTVVIAVTTDDNATYGNSSFKNENENNGTMNSKNHYVLVVFPANAFWAPPAKGSTSITPAFIGKVTDLSNAPELWWNLCQCQGTGSTSTAKGSTSRFAYNTIYPYADRAGGINTYNVKCTDDTTQSVYPRSWETGLPSYTIVNNPSIYHGDNSYFGQKCCFVGNKLFVQVNSSGVPSGVQSFTFVPSSGSSLTPIEENRSTPLAPSFYTASVPCITNVNAGINGYFLEGITYRKIDGINYIVMVSPDGYINYYPADSLTSPTRVNTGKTINGRNTTKYKLADNTTLAFLGGAAGPYCFRFQSSLGKKAVLFEAHPTSTTIHLHVISDLSSFSPTINSYSYNYTQTSSSEKIAISLISVTDDYLIFQTAQKTTSAAVTLGHSYYEESTQKYVTENGTHTRTYSDTVIKQFLWKYGETPTELSRDYHAVEVCGTIDYASGKVTLDPSVYVADNDVVDYVTTDIGKPYEGTYAKYNTTKHEND